MDLNQIISNTLVTLILTGVPIVLGLLAKLIVTSIKNSRNQADDRLAAIAVAWAEDHYGAGKGDVKLSAAAEKVSALSKGKITADQAATLVRASYQKLMGELSGLKK